MILTVFFLTSCIKLLLIPAYKSTDFEVHRNWLAITHNLPLKKWYFEETSEWTLDYPPLFAYFEYFLSFFAKLFDEKMLLVNNLNYDSKETLLFQRLSVILTDLVYLYGTYKISMIKKTESSWKTVVVLPILLITNCGLFMVDHIHFQYNGIMYGILLLSMHHMLRANYLWSALWFTILLNMKHIYVYLAPAYFIFLLKNYCIGTHGSELLPFLKRLFLLGSLVIAIFVSTFLPFYDHLGQVFSRMFPFKRGLCHAYWAPNFWALYNTLDKIAYFALKKAGFARNVPVAAMTGGLVQEFSHSVLPSVAPIATILLTAVFMLPAMLKLWRFNKAVNFVRCLVLCALTSFLFGWHVHEKAILMAVIPLSVLSVREAADAKVFLLLGMAAHYSLFPLLFARPLLAVKVLLLVLYSMYAFHSLSKIYPTNSTFKFEMSVIKVSFPLLNRFEGCYVLGFFLLFFYDNLGQFILGFNAKYPFLALMLTSVYCAIGVTYCWGKYYLYFLQLDSEVAGKNKKRQSINNEKNRKEGDEFENLTSNL